MSNAPGGDLTHATRARLLQGLIALLLVTGSSVVRASAPDAREIATALATERLGLAAGEATIAMELRDRAGRIVSRTIRARTASGAGWRKMRLTFQAPVDQRGVELLVLTEGTNAPVQYLWLPRSAELRRIAASDRGGRFQGSDFAFSDFEDQNLAAADVQLAGEETLSGLAAYRIEITARAGQPAPGGWSRVSAWIAKDARVPLRVEFYKDGTLSRTLEVKRLQPVEVGGGEGQRLMPTRLVMSDLSRGTRTTLDISGLAPSARFPDAVFAPEALGR